MTKVVFRVLDMHCSGCAMRLEELEELLPGVRRATASYHKRQLEVEFDEKLVDETAIIAAVKTLGYQAQL